MRRFLILGIILISLITIFARPVSAELRFEPGWQFFEFQPNIENGGRANTIAVHPLNVDVMIVASETGGLFRTTTRGATWTHIDGLPQFSTGAVAFVPSDPAIVLATTGDDFGAVSGAGIWRSADGGQTWTHMSPVWPGARTAGYDIAIAPDTGRIYIGTDMGLSVSDDKGLTWTLRDPFPSSSQDQVFSVVAQEGGRVITGGRGIARSTDGGATWVSPSTGVGIANSIHALAPSPFSPNDAYLVDVRAGVWLTEDSGDHWRKITTAPQPRRDNCGGIPFIKARGAVIPTVGSSIPRRSVTLYLGNRCDLWWLRTPLILADTGFDYSGAWTQSAVDHADTRDLAFTNNTSSPQPLLLATDGGVHGTGDFALSWWLTGGGRYGFNALQITEVKGQWITSLPRHDVYFATQDNSIWTSTDDGSTWTSCSICPEGFFIEREHRVPKASDSTITFMTCVPCANEAATAGFASVNGWPDPPGPLAGNPKIVRRAFHVQGVDASPFVTGLAVTTNFGNTWSQFVQIAQSRRDLPKVSDPGTNPVIYQAIRTGFSAAKNIDIHRLARVSTSSPVVTYPAMTNFGGLGINPTMFAWYQVFGVDPVNPQHLIAPDVINDEIMETQDGGDVWKPIAGLKSLVTGNGTFRFSKSVFPFISVVSFSQDDPNLVAIGTWQNGLFISQDRGTTWQQVAGSQRATYITSVEWRSTNTAIVSTYGRGLWMLAGIPQKKTLDYYRSCKDCVVRPVEPFNAAERFTHGIVVFGGKIEGATVSDRALRQLFVSPGAAVIRFSDRELLPLTVVETSKPAEFENIIVPPAREGEELRGFLLDERGTIAGATFSHGPLAAYVATEEEKNTNTPVGSPESPIAGRPYIEIASAGEANRIRAGSMFTVSGRSFARNAIIEIAIDEGVFEPLRTSVDGTFNASLVAPADFGLHRVVVRSANTHDLIDGTMFLAVHEDRADER